MTELDSNLQLHRKLMDLAKATRKHLEANPALPDHLLPVDATAAPPPVSEKGK